MKVYCWLYAGDVVAGIGRAWAAAGLSRHGFAWFPRIRRLDRYVFGLSWLWLHLQAGVDQVNAGDWEPPAAQNSRAGRPSS